jgi:hypothetical protein
VSCFVLLTTQNRTLPTFLEKVFSADLLVFGLVFSRSDHICKEVVNCAIARLRKRTRTPSGCQTEISLAAKD